MDRTAVIALVAFFLVISFIFGFVAGRVHRRKVQVETFGDLRVDRSDPDGPYLFLELDQSPDAFLDREIVSFKVVAKDYISTPQD